VGGGLGLDPDRGGDHRLVLAQASAPRAAGAGAMSGVVEREVVGDLSDLPTTTTGPRSLLWWGTFGFMLIEGTAFMLAAGSYLYLRGQNGQWPPAGHAPPDHLYGALFTMLLLASAWPNHWLRKRAEQKRTAAVRWGVALMALMGVALTVIRGFEFAHLNIRWDTNAYGSVTWLLIFLHATHLLTDLGDTIVLGVWLFTHEIGDEQFSDVVDNCGYWSFVVITWLPLYLLVYWGPRWL
jgi:heme/copper-type cytochrome/quinol oxidase subunit 3